MRRRMIDERQQEEVFSKWSEIQRSEMEDRLEDPEKEVDYTSMIREVLEEVDAIGRTKVQRPDLKKNKGTKSQKIRPAWAVSRAQAKVQEVEEDESVLDFMDNLDLGGFLQDLEVKNLVKGMKSRASNIDYERSQTGVVSSTYSSSENQGQEPNLKNQNFGVSSQNNYSNHHQQSQYESQKNEEQYNSYYEDQIEDSKNLKKSRKMRPSTAMSSKQYMKTFDYKKAAEINQRIKRKKRPSTSTQRVKIKDRKFGSIKNVKHPNYKPVQQDLEIFEPLNQNFMAPTPKKAGYSWFDSQKKNKRRKEKRKPCIVNHHNRPLQKSKSRKKHSGNSMGGQQGRGEWDNSTKVEPRPEKLMKKIIAHISKTILKTHPVSTLIISKIILTPLATGRNPLQDHPTQNSEERNPAYSSK